MQALLKLHNISQLTIWNDSKAELKKFRPISLSSHLSGLQEIPMQSFLSETKAYNTVHVNDDRNNTNKTFVAIIIITSALAVIVIVWIIARKCNCYLAQVTGKSLTNVHDLEKANYIRLPMVKI